jgi:hypothetical protein
MTRMLEILEQNHQIHPSRSSQEVEKNLWSDGMGGRIGWPICCSCWLKAVKCEVGLQKWIPLENAAKWSLNGPNLTPLAQVMGKNVELLECCKLTSKKRKIAAKMPTEIVFWVKYDILQPLPRKSRKFAKFPSEMANREIPMPNMKSV